MIQCPTCKRTLPDGNAHCQFCGADVSTVARPVPIQKPRQQSSLGSPTWVAPAYYITCSAFLVLGILGVVMGLVSHDVSSEILGAVNAAFALGMLLKIDLIRGIANVLLWVQLVLGILGTAGLLLAVTLFGPIMLIVVVLHIIRLAACGFLLYLISETDDFCNI